VNLKERREEIKKWLDESIKMEQKLHKIKESEELGLSFSTTMRCGKSIFSTSKRKSINHKKQVNSIGCTENC